MVNGTAILVDVNGSSEIPEGEGYIRMVSTAEPRYPY